jgi:hypothetical protein
MIGDRAFAVFLLLAVATAASAQQLEWTDPRSLRSVGFMA